MSFSWTHKVCLLLSITALIACGSEAENADWPRWRGPEGLGISSADELPIHWSADGAGIRWRAAIDGVGTSSPIALGDRVYVTSAKAVARDVELQVHAYDLGSGESLWQSSVARRRPERSHQMNTSAGPTPVTDGDSIFAYFGSHLAAIDRDGDVKWAHEIDPDYLKESRYAAGSSLVLFDDLVIVLRDRERVGEELVGWMAAYDKGTGERVWYQEWDDSCCSYTTPLVLDRPGKPGAKQLFVVLAGYVASFDPETGELIERAEQGIAQPVASPVVEGNLICVASGAHANREALCFEVAEDPEQPSWKPLWRFPRWVPDTSSPLLINGRFYLLTEKGILRSLDARSGEMLWQIRLESAGYRASLVAGAGKIYALGETGVVSVISPEDGAILAVNRLPESRYVASPAIAGDCLVFRSWSELVCVEGTGAASAAPEKDE